MSRKKEKSGFLSAFGTGFEILKRIIDAVLELGGNDDDMRRVLTDSSLVKKVAEVIMASKQKVSETYKVVVDYGLSLAEMIKLGKYDWFNDDINDEHFPFQITDKQDAEVVLVHMNQDVTTKEIREYMTEQGLEPAKIEYLLAFGAAYPELQRQFPIIALGSSFVSGNGDRDYPCLYCYDGKRKLNLLWSVDDSHWNEACRFLAVRK